MKTLEALGMILQGKPMGKKFQGNYRAAFRLLAKYSEDLPSSGSELWEFLNSLSEYRSSTVLDYWGCIKGGYEFMASEYGMENPCEDVPKREDKNKKMRYRGLTKADTGDDESWVIGKDVDRGVALAEWRAKRADVSELASIVVRPAPGYGIKRKTNEDGCVRADKMLGKVSSYLECPFMDCVGESGERDNISCRPILKDQDIMLIKGSFEKIVGLGLDEGRAPEYSALLRRILRKQLKRRGYVVGVECKLLKLGGHGRKFRTGKG